MIVFLQQRWIRSSNLTKRRIRRQKFTKEEENRKCFQVQILIPDVVQQPNSGLKRIAKNE